MMKGATAIKGPMMFFSLDFDFEARMEVGILAFTLQSVLGDWDLR